jgi:DNA polymerase
VLTVHDELVTEPVDVPEFTAEGLSAILATNPSWAPGFPLAAKGFESYRYRKDD